MSDNATFELLDPEFFASFEQKMPGAEYRSVVAGLATGGWTVAPGGVWTHVMPPGWSGLRQGWKLHLSATPVNAATVLANVARVLEDDPAAFKFASDRAMLYLMTSKNWPREGGGKFVTVYPADEDQFRRLAATLAEATAGLEGPYILSDRRVPGSRIVFYRYGEHQAAEGVDAWGQRVQHVISPKGERVSDRRQGYYRVPSWVDDPYGARSTRVLDSVGGKVTLRGRYEIHGALKFSNLGGVYRGQDLERGQPVVVRERRPYTGWIDDSTDGVALLEKEARILRLMDGTGWTPGFVDAFQVWEHHYLVMEEVRGMPLREYALSRYLGRRRIGSPRWLFTTFRRVVVDLLRALDEFHRRGVILRDLTAGNVLVRPDRSLCIIDFEFAWERGGAQPYAPGIHTPGSASPQQMAGSPPVEADDYYALGAVVIELCSMMAPGLGLNRAGVVATAAKMMDEVGLPCELLDIAQSLVEPDASARWDAAPVRRVLAGVRASDLPWRAREPGRSGAPAPEATTEEGLGDAVSAVCEELCRFFEASPRPEQHDRLWPASPDAYRSNGVCIQFGACGPVEYVRRLRGACPDAWLDWVEEAAVPERCPPGMYVGLAGIALTLAACGRKDPARRLLLTATESPLLASIPGLYQGVAGVGVSALALATHQGDPELREAAVRIGDDLEGRAERRTRGLAWRIKDVIPCGLGSGGSGIALFYTYLGACTGEERYWNLARQALDYEFSQVSWRAGYAFWPSTGGRRKKFRSPHVFFGSAGVATAALRLYACTGWSELREWAERATETLTFRWTNKLWQDFGYAGWGDTLLDMHSTTGNARYRHQALRMAEVLLPMRVKTRFGTAFPGGTLNRVASDFGMGASGIGLFLHRLVTPGTHRAFFPDHLIPGWPVAAPPQARVDPASRQAHPGTAGS
jgi:tRNA A-37 threonylcarbamoyl transferase component Bud32